MVLLSATKLLDATRITAMDQLVLQQDDVTSNHPVVLPSEKSGFTQVQQLNSAARQLCTRVEKRAASIFKLFCSNVPRRVGEFCCSYYRALTDRKWLLVRMLQVLSVKDYLTIILRYFSNFSSAALSWKTKNLNTKRTKILVFQKGWYYFENVRVQYIYAVFKVFNVCFSVVAHLGCRENLGKPKQQRMCWLWCER